jgi:hypothetical protein
MNTNSFVAAISPKTPANDIRLTHYPNRGFVGSVKTEVNGVELQQVTDIQLSCPVDGLPTLRVTQFAGPELDITLQGIVQPTVLLDERALGLELHVEQTSPTSTRYWVVRK